jgi:4-hydroxy-4-methyl-2-oxoglutarate aldolase
MPDMKGDAVEPGGQAGTARLTTAHVCDVSPAGITMDPGIAAIWPGARVAGPAFTVKVATGDNASLMTALRRAEPGDVLVVDAGGSLERGLWGAILSTEAQRRGIAGMVIDGAVRDCDEIAELRFPVFARGRAPTTPYSKVPGHVGRTVTCGGIEVAPGDAVYGDGDGVVAVTAADHDATVERALHRIGLEDQILEGLAAGRPLAELLPILAATRRSGEEVRR